MTAVCRGSSKWALISEFPLVLNKENLFSIIEGTQESLARLGLDYVDIIFAHRHDHSGMSRPP